MQHSARFKRSCISLAIAQALTMSASQAATITVNDAGDTSAADANCTLREALDSANTNPGNTTSGCVSGDPGLDTIVFDAGLVGPITLTQGTSLSALSEMTIQGPGAANLTIDASGNGTASAISFGGVSPIEISDLTISGASKTGDGGALYIRLADDVTISDVTITGNRASGNGGGIGILDSTVDINDVVIENNYATLEGGGLWNTGSGTLTIDSTTIDGNNAATNGGGILNSGNGTLTIADTTIDGNSASADGGGIWNSGTTLNIDNTTISRNSALDGDGGGFSIQGAGNVTITGSTIDSNIATGNAFSAGGGIYLRDSASVTVNGGAISNNTGFRFGGGIRAVGTSTLTLEATRITGNATDLASQRYGGGVALDSRATLISNDTYWAYNNSRYGGALASRYGSDLDIQINRNTFHRNSATAQGGALRLRFTGNTTIDQSTFTGNSANNGGGAIGIFSGMVATITNSTVSGNMAGGGGGIAVSGGDLTLTNSTISGNSTTNYAGGLSVSSLGYATIVNSTISDNATGSQGGGGIRVFSTNGTTLVNTIVAGNTATIGNEVLVSNSQTLTANANNIFGSEESTNSQAFVSFTPGANDLNLTIDNGGPTFPITGIVDGLADNGGLTQTHALANNSPAIDAGDAAQCTTFTITLDQRGEERDDSCDIGAYEFIEDGTFFIIPTANGGATVIEM